MTAPEIEACAIAALRDSLQGAPAYGSVGLVLHFHGSQLSRIETSRSEAFKPGGDGHG